MFVWRLTRRLLPAGSEKAGWGGMVQKIWLFAPRFKRMAKPCFVMPAGLCGEWNLPLSPPFPGWVIHRWGLPSSLALHRGVSHKANGLAGPPSDPFKARPLCGPVPRPHPCCPAPYYKCQRILIWLWVTKSSPGQCLCATAIKKEEKGKKKTLTFIQATARRRQYFISDCKFKTFIKNRPFF